MTALFGQQVAWMGGYSCHSDGQNENNFVKEHESKCVCFYF